MVPEPRDTTRRLICTMDHEASEPLPLKRGSNLNKERGDAAESEAWREGKTKPDALRGEGNEKRDAEHRGTRQGIMQEEDTEPVREPGKQNEKFCRRRRLCERGARA